MWQALLAREVFSVGSRPYVWADIALDAMCRGTWKEFERFAEEGLACEAHAEREKAWPALQRVEEAGNDFRYEHDLLAAADLTAWLSRTGLSLREWHGFLQRQLLRADLRELLASLTSDAAPAVSDLLKTAPADALCSRTVQHLAQSLAGRVAVVERAQDTAPAPWPIPAAVVMPDTLEGVNLEWFPSWPLEDLHARARHLGEIAARFDNITRQALTATALEAQLRGHRRDWTRVDIEGLACRDESTAHEAMMCVREDGMRLSEVAASSGLLLERRSVLLEDVSDDWQDAVLSTPAGEVVGPCPRDDRWEVLTVVAKRAANLDDPVTRERAETAVVAELVTAAAARIRWHVVL